jgi:hypothetical protein
MLRTIGGLAGCFGVLLMGCSGDGSVRATSGGPEEACREFAERRGMELEGDPDFARAEDGSSIVVLRLASGSRHVCYVRLERGRWWLEGIT